MSLAIADEVDAQLTQSMDSYTKLDGGLAFALSSPF